MAHTGSIVNTVAYDFLKSPRYLTALAYARQGIPVFPCIKGAKRPATPNGLKDRTTDVDRITGWWRHADYNVAIVPEDAGWCVIDLDPKNDGFENWRKLCAEHGEPPATYTVATPSGGLHLYFKGSLPPTAGKLALGIDTRGRDSYVLVPPSVISGGADYRVIQ